MSDGLLGWMSGIGVFLLAASAWLLKTGWWPRRQGDAPVCAGCGYLLVGNQSGRCPECGNDLATPGRVCHGERRRRLGRVLAGLLLGGVALALLGLVAAGPLRQVDWYRYRPLAWLLNDLQSPVAGRPQRAWVELNRRRGDPAVAAQVEERLTLAALEEQAKSTPGPIGQPLVDYLGERYLARKLTAEQAECFLAQAGRLELKVRPRILAGEDVVFVVTMVGRRPADIWSHQHWTEQVKLGDKVVYTDWGRFPASGTTAFGRGFKVENAGEHAVEIIHRVRLHYRSGETVALGGEYRAALSGLVRVLEPGSPDPLEQIEDEGIKQRLLNAFQVTWQDSGNGRTHFPIQVNDAPTNMAFDVIARAEGREFPLRTKFSMRKGDSGQFFANEVELLPGSAFPDARVDLILRTSVPAAKWTVDFFDVWKGELVFEGLQLTKRAR